MVVIIYKQDLMELPLRQYYKLHNSKCCLASYTDPVESLLTKSCFCIECSFFSIYEEKSKAPNKFGQSNQ